MEKGDPELRDVNKVLERIKTASWRGRPSDLERQKLFDIVRDLID